MFILKVAQGPDAGRALRLVPGKSYTIGCDEASTIQLSDPMVLKGHCSIEVDKTFVVLRNHTATAGTFVGDKKVSQAKLGHNTSFRIGETLLSLHAAPQQQKPPPGPDPLIGKILGGYKLKEVVGEGGMGKVYKATQLSLHRDVALKVLREKLAKDKSFRDLFINEARAAAQLVHSNVVQVYDAGIEGEVTFFSMEFIGQGSVEEILKRDKQIPWEQAILMVLEAAHGLAYAEGKGIVHRDIKPDNLMLNDDGRVKIADLGLAKQGESPNDHGIIGTPHFIPPEQALGKVVDTRADIYSLGATFFRMITGRTVFSGKTAKEIVLKHIKEPPPAASSVQKGVPDDLDLVISRMLAKDPNQRFATAQDLIASLEEVCAHHGIKGSIIKKGVSKRVLIPLVLLLLAAGGTIFHFATKAPPVDHEAQKAAQIAEQRAEAEAKKRKEAEQAQLRERQASEAQSRFNKLELDEARTENANALESVYDEKDGKDLREKQWREVAENWRNFGNSELAKQFGNAKKALERAADIETALREAREAQELRSQKIEEQLSLAEERRAKHYALVADLRQARHFEQAANLCQAPIFKENRAWEWVNPYKKDPKPQSVDKIPVINDFIEKHEKYFADEYPAIIEQAERDWETVRNAVEAVDETAEIEALQKAVEALDGVIDNYPDTREGARDIEAIDKIVADARARRTRLRATIEERRQKILADDRTTVRLRMLQLATFAPVRSAPNPVMNCDFGGAHDRWRDLSREVKTPLYQQFVQERMDMLRYCEWLFHALDRDMRLALAGKDAPLKTLDVDLPGPQRMDLREPSKPYYFAVNRRYEGHGLDHFMGEYPMDWVYNALFFHQGECRWKDPDPITRFALGAFAFETMQYEKAEEQFSTLVNDPRYGEAAKSLLSRAVREKAARKEWEALCERAAAEWPIEDASIEKLTALQQQINQYMAQYEGTLYSLDVLPTHQAPTFDFYSTDYAKLPTPPPPPKN